MKLFQHLKIAYRTIDIQVGAAIVLGLGTVIVYASNADHIEPLIAFALYCIWPSIAFVINCINPQP